MAPVAFAAKPHRPAMVVVAQHVADEPAAAWLEAAAAVGAAAATTDERCECLECVAATATAGSPVAPLPTDAVAS